MTAVSQDLTQRLTDAREYALHLPGVCNTLQTLLYGMQRLIVTTKEDRVSYLVVDVMGDETKDTIMLVRVDTMELTEFMEDVRPGLESGKLPLNTQARFIPLVLFRLVDTDKDTPRQVRVRRTMSVYLWSAPCPHPPHMHESTRLTQDQFLLETRRATQRILDEMGITEVGFLAGLKGFFVHVRNEERTREVSFLPTRLTTINEEEGLVSAS